MSNYFITGIGTGVGKTFISAILTEALEADYWKPIQCGTEGGTDVSRITDLISNDKTRIHEEAYCFDEPVSPHMAAARQGASIAVESIELPESFNQNMIIEGAGGILVPLNGTDYVIDLARYCEAEIILVCSSYLGCINHSLLSLDFLLKSDMHIKGLVLNGNFDPEVRKAIIKFSELPIIAEIPHITEVSKETVKAQTKNVDLSLF